MNFKHGTNISHWLSQSTRREAGRRTFFTRDDVRRIADWGFDHIRLPVDEEQLWDKAGGQEREAFDLMDAALDWCEEAGLRAIVDLHILRSHHFNAQGEPALFTDPAEAVRFAGFWRELSAHLRPRRNDRVAYELMNEAVAARAADWNRVARSAFDAIRETEPARTVVLGSNRWNSVTTFDELDVPADRHLVLTFHFYHPMLITHHQATWWAEGRDYTGPVQYPGHPIPAEALAQVPEPLRSKLAAMNQPYGREQMLADLAKPLAVARRTGLPLYCGEFGVYKTVPWPAREAWYRDLVGVLTEQGIGWANWDYKGGFALVEAGRSTGVAEAMLSAAGAR